MAWMREHQKVSLIALGSTAVLISLLAWQVASLPALHRLFGGNTTVPRAGSATASTTPTPTTNRENQQAGTSAWMLDPGANPTLIQGYAGQVSALPGDMVPIYVSTATSGIYALTVYRLGWYGGAGGRQVFARDGLQSTAQGTWTRTGGLLNCVTCTQDPQTHLIEAHWRQPFILPVGADWVSGVYLIKLTQGDQGESYIPLVVRAANPGAVLLVSLPVMTYQAYNLWGGYNLYQQASNTTLGGEDSARRAMKVSFDRPYDRSSGAGDLLNWDLQSIRWLERQGQDIDYTTNIDVADHPETLLMYRAFITIGHDEYWTKSMRDGAENARDHGVSLMFLGANDAYWQARLEPDAEGITDRTLVCYKVLSQAKTADAVLRNDPDYPADPAEVTTQWRDPLINRPESLLIGLMYHSFFRFQPGSPSTLPDWVVAKNLHDPLLAGTGLIPGEHIRGGLLGYEFDGPGARATTPNALVILAASPVTDIYGGRDMAMTGYYRAPSGALIFDAGSIWWSWGLDVLAPPGATQSNILHGNPKIQALTANILRAMLNGPNGPHAPQATPTPTN